MQSCPIKTGRLYEVTAMYPRNMTRQEYKQFLIDHADLIFDSLLTTDSYLLDCIVIDELGEEFAEYQKVCGDYWEAC